MNDVEERLGELEAQFLDLLKLVKRQPVAVSFPLPRWNWTRLSDAELAADRAALGRWVCWLTEAYALLDRWPVCWHEHSDVVTWVVALWSWHRSVYAPEVEITVDAEPGPKHADATATEPSPRSYWEWHTFALRPFLTDILPSLTKQCATKHVESSAAMQRQHRDQRTAMNDGVRHFVGQPQSWHHHQGTLR